MTASDDVPGLTSVAEEQPESSADLLSVGMVLDDRYRVVRPIGRGGMGEVYEGRQLGLDRRVAIKVLRPQHGSLAAARKRFEREARAMARIESDHVATIFDFGAGPRALLYLVMEYLEGRDLRALLNEQNVLPAPRAARLMNDACRGLIAAHEQGVIHRDLKPENLFVVARDGREVCKVLDFGLAKLRVANRSDLPTRVGIPLGTLHYMSPEQARGDADIDERADVYGCAAVLYELLTGRRPYTAESAHGLLYKIIHESPKRVDQVSAYVSASLADVVQLGLARDRNERPESIRAFAELLEPFIVTGSSGSLDVRNGGPETSSDTESRIGALVEQPARHPDSARRRWWPVALTAGALLGSAGTWKLARTSPAAPRSETVGPAARAARLDGASLQGAITPSAVLTDTTLNTRPGPIGPTLDGTNTPSAQPPSPRAAKRRLPPAKKAAGEQVSSFERRNPYD